jgi:hypothetical protein
MAMLAHSLECPKIGSHFHQRVNSVLHRSKDTLQSVITVGRLFSWETRDLLGRGMGDGDTVHAV